MENQINENKEDLCLEIYGVRYFRLCQFQRDIIDRIYSKRILEGGYHGI